MPPLLRARYFSRDFLRVCELSLSSSIDSEISDKWRRGPGIFVVTDVRGELGDRIQQIQRTYDPKLASYLPPHVTLVGSSGVGPIEPSTDRGQLRAIMEEIAATTPPLALKFGKPLRFMQTDIIVLPLDPHGALRELHERIVRSGLSFHAARFAFTPHVTLSFFRTLTPESRRELLSIREEGTFELDHIRCSLTDEPLPPRDLFELRLTGESR